MEIEGQERRNWMWTVVRGFLAENWSWIFFAASIGVGLFALYFVVTDELREGAKAWEKFLYYFIPVFGFGATMIVFLTVLWRDGRKGRS